MQKEIDETDDSHSNHYFHKIVLTAVRKKYLCKFRVSRSFTKKTLIPLQWVWRAGACHNKPPSSPTTIFFGCPWMGHKNGGTAKKHVLEHWICCCHTFHSHWKVKTQLEGSKISQNMNLTLYPSKNANKHSNTNWTHSKRSIYAVIEWEKMGINRKFSKTMNSNTFPHHHHKHSFPKSSKPNMALKCGKWLGKRWDSEMFVNERMQV